MPTILVTGFEPFGRDRVNPSAEIAQALARDFSGGELGGARIATRVLPVSRKQIFQELDRALEETRPQAVVGLGLADGRSVVSVEERAVNLESYPIPDNDGEQPSALPIQPGGPDSLPGTFPTDELVDAIRRVGIPAAASSDAGAYLCNRFYYESLLRAEQAPVPAPYRVTFLHLPSLPECVAEAREARASMSLELSRRAVEATLAYIARSLA